MDPLNSLETKAELQLKELEIHGKIGSGKKRSASTPRSVMSPTGSSASCDGDVKKLPMNKIVVGTAPSPQVSKVTSKIGSLSNASYKPQKPSVKIESKKLEFSKSAKSRVGSLGNVGHVAGGGAVKIPVAKVTVKAESRIGSLSNVKYKPQGGDKKIFDDKDYLKRARSSGSDLNERGRSSSLARGD